MIKLGKNKKELWEDLFVVWRHPATGTWWLTPVTNHHASADPAEPKRVTQNELTSGILREGAIHAGSKQEALLRHVASGRGGDVWSVSFVGYVRDDVKAAGVDTRFWLEKEAI